MLIRIRKDVAVPIRDAHEKDIVVIACSITGCIENYLDVYFHQKRRRLSTGLSNISWKFGMRS